MKRLSDRAFQLVKDEIDRYYSPEPDSQLSQTKALERMILLARLQALHERSGKSLTQAQLWEAICDILPQIDRKTLKQASRNRINAPLVGASLGLGAASLGAAAVLLSNPLGNSNGQAKLLSNPPAQAPPINAAVASTQISSQHKSTYETARAFGWQAALKGENPPHSAQHWSEAAALWQQAINLLDQVPRYDKTYEITQAKKAEYQGYLQQVQARQLAAQNRETATAPKFSRTVSSKTTSKTLSDKSSQQPPTAAAQVPKAQQTQASQEDFLAIAKSYGWKAALASQNAPHPVEKWADISRLWQLALQNLDKIDSQHANYTEAQQVKAQYQKNLTAIRQRYRAEQDASQRLQSLQAALLELEASQIGNSTTKHAQMQAIVSRLGTIPANTIAYRQAQQLISVTNERIQALLKSSTQIAISAEEN
ncbi:MAG: hypothetical protein AAGB19_05580 [Cyanobacteria bacterium P01_F01_bin.3]